MKAIVTAMVLVFSLTSVTAFACPKGTHLVGGTGPHHKGGNCVANEAKASNAKAASPKAEAKKSKKKSKKKAAEAAK